MKTKIFLIVIFTGLLTMHLAEAQEKNNLIKTSLVFPLAEAFSLSYERMLNDEMSLQLTGFVGEFVGAAIMPEFRYYLSENKIAPSGTFVAPYVLLAEESGGGIMVGVQRLFKSKLSLEAFLGPMVMIEGGVAAMGGINIGIAF